MKKMKKRVNPFYARAAAMIRKNGGFGINELLGTAAALIIAAFIIIPGLKEFSQSVVGELKDWWDDTILSRIFPTS